MNNHPDPSGDSKPLFLYITYQGTNPNNPIKPNRPDPLSYPDTNRFYFWNWRLNDPVYRCALSGSGTSEVHRCIQQFHSGPQATYFCGSRYTPCTPHSTWPLHLSVWLSLFSRFRSSGMLSAVDEGIANVTQALKVQPPLMRVIRLVAEGRGRGHRHSRRRTAFSYHRLTSCFDLTTFLSQTISCLDLTIPFRPSP